MENKPIVLFVPEAGVFSFLRTLCVIGDAMRELGHPVYLTHCTGQLPRCPVKVMSNLSPSAPQEDAECICAKCMHIYRDAQARHGFFSIEMAELLTEEDFELAASLCTEDRKLEDATLNGFHVGKAAQYDLALECKAVFSSELAAANRDMYVAYIKNTAIAQIVSDKICRNLAPAALITFNQYAQCEAVKFSARQFGCTRPAVTLPLHKGANGSLLLIETDNCDRWFCEHRMLWPQYLHNPVSAKVVRECWDDVLFRAYEQDIHVYSPKKTGDPGLLYDTLRIDPGKKLVLALPSCREERASLETSVKLWGEQLDIKDVFSSQIVWLKALSDWARGREDVQLVVRVHPRDGKTKRDTTVSAQLAQFETEFLSGHEHCRFIWPMDPVSSYDLAELADVACVSWSGMGMELMRMGILMLGCTGHFHYVDSACIKVPDSPEEYFDDLESLLASDVAAEHVIQGCRYYFWRSLIPYLDLSETVPRHFKDATIWPKAPPTMYGPIRDLVYGTTHAADYNIAQWFSSITEYTEEEELAELLDCVKFYLDFVFTNTPQSTVAFYRDKILNRLKKLVGMSTEKKELCVPAHRKSSTLIFSPVGKVEECLSASRKNRNLYFMISDGLTCVYVRSGKAYTRTSKQLSRLAKIAADKIES